MNLFRLFAALMLFISLPAAEAAPERVAVLELGGAADPSVLRLLTDEVRGGVLRAVPRRDLMVMTRENMVVLAKDMGLDLSCIEGECEVETGRNIGAAFVVSGEVVDLDGSLNLILKLHDVNTGALLSTKRVASRSREDLLDKAGPLSNTLMKDGISEGAAGTAPPPAALEPGDMIVTGTFGAAPKLGVQDLLASQACDEEGGGLGRAARNARIARAVADLKVDSTSAWQALEPDLRASLKLPLKERGRFIAALEKWLAAAENMSISLAAGVETVETSCGERSPAFASEARRVWAPELSEARKLLASLKAEGQPAAPVRSVTNESSADRVPPSSTGGGGAWGVLRPDMDELFAMLVWYGGGTAEFAQGSGSMEEMASLNPSSGPFFEACGRFNIGPVYGPAVHMIIGGRDSEKGAPLYALSESASIGNSGIWGDFGLSAGLVYPNRWLRPFVGYRASASWLAATKFSGGKQTTYFYVPHGVEAGLEVGPGAGLRVQIFRAIDGKVQRQQVSMALFFPGSI